MSENEEGLKKIKTTTYEEDTYYVVNTKEYNEALSHINDIITDVAKKYVDFDNYDITTEEDLRTVGEGTELEYDVFRMFVYVIDLVTQEEEEIGKIEYGDNCWNHVTDREKRNGYIVLYDDEDIREDAEELFKKWAEKEKEQGQTPVNVKEDERLKRVNMNSSEYSDAIAHYYEDIILKVAQKYLDLNKYEIDTQNWTDVYNEGLPSEYGVQYLDVLLYDKATKNEELIGQIDIGDDSFSHVTKKERDNGYIVLYSDKDIREQAEELFKNWADEEAERDE